MDYKADPDPEYIIIHPEGVESQELDKKEFYEVVQTVEVPIKMETTPTKHPEGQQLKRELKLARNRESARKSRMKKRSYIQDLELRVVKLEKQNQKLADQIRAMKAEIVSGPVFTIQF